MYIDARKIKSSASYTNEELERDKSFSKSIYLKWFNDHIDEIISRLFEINDIGVVERVGNFVKLIKECEYTYALGAYHSTIALAGISAEDLTRFFATLSGRNTDDMKQFHRINELERLGLISSDIKDRLHKIRLIRNDCLHFNSAFSSRSSIQLKADAIECINELKSIYSTIIGCTTLNAVDYSKLKDIIEAIAHSAASQEEHGVLNVEDALLRTRNVIEEITGLNLSINLGGQTVIQNSIFVIEEIDLEIDPPEVTLIDSGSGHPVIVDLTAEDISQIKEQDIKEGSAIFATLKSTTNGLGTTGVWRFERKLTVIS